MKMVKLLNTSGSKVVDAIKVTNDDGRNTITKQSKVKPKRKYSYKHCHKYYLRNKERLRAYSHRYYQENRAKILEQKRAHNALPIIKVKRARYAKGYYQRNKAKANEKKSLE